MIVAGSFTQDPAGAEDARRFLEQYTRAHLRAGPETEFQPQDIEAATVVGQMVGGVVIAEVLQTCGDGGAVGRQHCQGFVLGSGQALAPGESKKVDGPLGRGVRVPGPTVVGVAVARMPRGPQGLHPGGVGVAAKQRQPGEAVEGEQSFDIGKGPLEQICLVAGPQVQCQAG